MFCAAAVVLLLSSLHPGSAQKSESLKAPKPQPVFQGSDRYDFAVIVPPSDSRCFFHFAKEHGYFFFGYEVQWSSGFTQDRHVAATAHTPDGFLIESSEDVRGQINFQTKETGYYQVCVNNWQNRFGSVQIYLNFGAFYDGEGEEHAQDHRQKLNDTVSAIQESAQVVQGRVLHMWRYYNFARMRKRADFFLLLSNYNYVNWWSACTSLLIVASGVLQLFFLKRLFLLKPTPDAQKQRF